MHLKAFLSVGLDYLDDTPLCNLNKCIAIARMMSLQANFVNMRKIVGQQIWPVKGQSYLTKKTKTIRMS